MVYCVQVTVAFSSAARRDQCRTAILGRGGSKGRWGVDVLDVGAIDLGTNGLWVEWRFVAKADADDLFAFLAARTPAPLAGSRMVEHSCSHDEGSNVCTVLQSKAW